jgi:hypothetical protein
VLDRFVVSKIYNWDDIIDEYGRTLVTSWVMGLRRSDYDGPKNRKERI